MSRTKAYECAEVLQKALTTFMENGYAATSIQDLVAATGVNRQSLYNEFGDKRGLYLMALKFYCDRGLEEVRAILTLEQPARMVLEKYKNFLKGKTNCPTASRGCLIVTTLMGATHEDPEARKVLEAMFGEKQRLLASVIERGQKAGELPSKHTPEALAGSIHAALSGMTVLARGGTPCEQRQAILDVAFEGLV